MDSLSSLIAGSNLKTLLAHTHAMIALIGSDGGLLDENAAFESFKPPLPKVHSLYDLLSAGDRTVFREWVAEAQRSNQAYRGNLVLGTSEKRESCFDCLLIPLPDEKLIFMAQDITSDPNLAAVVQRLSRQVKLFKVESAHAKQIAINKQIEVNAILAQTDEIQHFDPLTFLPNRRLIMNALQDEVNRAERYRTPLSISMLDVDHFKSINDTYGHMVGDEVLAQIGHHLRDHIRQPDRAGRYGGEEFLILLPNTSIKSAAVAASRLCEEIRNAKMRAATNSIQLTVSVGIAELALGSETWQKLLTRADQAMYQAKALGRDQWSASPNK